MVFVDTATCSVAYAVDSNSVSYPAADEYFLYSGDDVNLMPVTADSTHMLFKDYFTSYHNPNDILRIYSSGSGGYVMPEDGIPLGYSDKPFAGVIEFPSGATNVTLPKAMFDYLSTDVTVRFRANPGAIGIVHTGDPDNLDSALFAEHIVAGASALDIGIRLANGSSGSYGGVFGEIGTNAAINLEFIDEAGLDVAANGDAGIFAGAMLPGSELTVTFTPKSGQTYSVQTHSGAAGGLVGRMEEGSKFILQTSIENGINVSNDGPELSPPAIKVPEVASRGAVQMSIPQKLMKMLSPAEQDAASEGAIDNELQSTQKSGTEATQSEQESKTETDSTQQEPNPTEETAPDVQSEPEENLNGQGDVNSASEQESDGQGEAQNEPEQTQNEQGEVQGEPEDAQGESDDSQSCEGDAQEETGAPDAGDVEENGAEGLVGRVGTTVTTRRIGLSDILGAVVDIVYALDEPQEEPVAENAVGSETGANAETTEELSGEVEGSLDPTAGENPSVEPSQETDGGLEPFGGETPADKSATEPNEEGDKETLEGLGEGKAEQQGNEAPVDDKNKEEGLAEPGVSDEKSEGAIDTHEITTEDALEFNPELLSLLSSPKVMLMQAAPVPQRSVQESYSNGYVGGLVGWAKNAEIIFDEGITVSVSGNINGTGASGGVFGRYESLTDAAVINPGMIVSPSGCAFDVLELKPIIAGGNAGGVYGILYAVNSITIETSSASIVGTQNSYHIETTFGSITSAGGGIIGKYDNTSLDNTLSIHDIKVKINNSNPSNIDAGGLIGLVVNESYITVSAVAVKGSNLDGGIVGNLGSAGSFLDVSGNVYIAGKASGGIVGDMQTGVVRLQGHTYFQYNEGSLDTSNGGQIANNRDRGLIYALGDGTNESSGWALTRGTGTRYGDIHDWGEVLRLSNTLTESALFAVDMTKHTVTVTGPVITGISDVVDFAKTALNIQFNYGTNTGALRFASLSPDSFAILSNPISLESGAVIDLSGTGLTGFTRDNYFDNFGVFSSSFDGSGGTIIMATGEKYGCSTGNTPVVAEYDNARGNGIICNHRYVGLFAKSSSGADIKNITLSGIINVYARKAIQNSGAAADIGEYYTGGLVAHTLGSLTLSAVRVTAEIHNLESDNQKSYVGGAVGTIGEASGTTRIFDGLYAAQITDINGSTQTYTSGIIGGILTKSNYHIINIHDIELEGSYVTSGDGSFKYGGMISGIHQGSNVTTRYNVINIINSTIGALTVTQKSNGLHGGMLGYLWNTVDASIDGLTVNGASVSIKNGAITGASGLIATATGHITVTGNGINVQDAAIAAESSNPSFGFIVNKAATDNATLFLEVNASSYNLGGLSVSGDFSVFDEIAAYTHVSTSDLITDNNAAVISIETPEGAMLFDGGEVNTYQNQTGYGKAGGKYNINSRYYYNISSLREKASGGALTAEQTGGVKALLWSLTVYGHSSISEFFTGGFNNTLSGNIDLTGISYYPVSAIVTINGASIKFDNALINNGEDSSTAVGDRFARRTDGLNQHYLMHGGLIYNASSIIVNDLTLQGNTGRTVNASTGAVYSGALVVNMLGGGNDMSNSYIDGVTLSGIIVADATGYAPLLVNKIGSKTTLNVSGISTYGYSDGAVAASSLFGKAGSESAESIEVTFSDMRLDARAVSSSPSSLNAAYNTKKSVFYRATLFDEIEISNSGDYLFSYDFRYDEDWNNGNGIHHVTYGQEISTSVEFEGGQYTYYGSNNYYVHPTNSTLNDLDVVSSYFANGWMPYVYNSDNDNHASTASALHEVRINYVIVNLTEGCGRYNHPYVVTDGAVFYSVDLVLRGTIGKGFEITLPQALESTAPSSMNMWCEGTDQVYVSARSGDQMYFYKKSNPSVVVSFARVREYLAGAYYEIDDDIVLPNTFKGLGGAPKNSGDIANGYEYPYAFRGVVVGSNHPTVTLNDNSAFIRSANGAVIKGVDFRLDSGITLRQDLLTGFTYDEKGCLSYGMVIAQVMGGDNIIDEVGLLFGENASISAIGTYGRTVPIGGYVGVVLNGGLIFRNMSSVGAVKRAGLNTGIIANVSNTGTTSDSGYLYVNPIIGRVIAGYAFNETTSYATTSAVLNNGIKNYGIPDLDMNQSDSSKLNVTGGSVNNLYVTIPDSQAFFVLSCIVNSGSGSAAFSTNSTGSFADKTNTPWIAYRNYTATRHGSYILNPQSNDASGDKYSGTAKVPYIVAKYTKPYNTVYQARSVCGNNGNTDSLVKRITLANDTYDLPAAFRGIGSIYVKGEKRLALRFNAIAGNGAALNLNMDYREYSYDYENYKPYGGTASSNSDSPGFGLFNELFQMSADSSNAIKDFTISGNVLYHIYTNQGAVSTYDKDDSQNKNSKGYSIMEVGGLGGKVYDRSVYIENVTMTGLTIQGFREAGGLLGYVRTNKKNANGTVTIKSCRTDQSSPVRILSGWNAGGLIGALSWAQADISGGDDNLFLVNEVKIDAPSSNMTKTTDFFGDPGYLYSPMSTGCLIGFVDCSDAVTISGLTIRGMNVTTTLGHTLSSAAGNPYLDYAGGLIGAVKSSVINIRSCTIDSVSMDSGYAGGLIGYIYQNDDRVSSFTVDDVIINGNSQAISGSAIAGGFFGAIREHHKNYNLTINVSGSSISNYTIASTHSNGNAAGIIFGAYQDSGRNNNTLSINDFYADNCRVETHYSTEGDKTGTALLFGADYITDTKITSYPIALYGYNLLFNGCSIEHYNGSNRVADLSNYKTVARIIGNNSKDSVVRLSGISLCENTYNGETRLGGKNASTATDYIGTNSLVVFADYFGVSAGGSKNTTPSAFISGSNVGFTEPYVTLNPFAPIGTPGALMTSDGFSPSVAAIIDDESDKYGIAGSSQYKTIYTSYGSISSFSAVIAAAASIDGFSDFPVLILNEENENEANDIVNAYINLLANTVVDYGQSSPAATASLYDISISRMAMNQNGTFAQADAPSLTRDGNGFKKEFGLADNNRNSFTLIDIAYKDPANTNNIAYHLYLPIIVQKIMSFDFSAKVLSGTTYRESAYSENKALANSGTPVTLLLKYSYEKADLEDAIANGADESSSFGKTITLKLSEEGDYYHYSDDVNLSLIDKQTGEVYYASFGAVYNRGEQVLDFSGFRNLGGTTFSALTLSELINTTTGAVLSEDYYLTFYTKKNVVDNTFYSVFGQEHLINDLPTKNRKSVEVHEATMITGNVYSVRVTSIESQGGDANHVIDADNHVINATISSIIQLNDSDMVGYMDSMYHSFVVSMAKFEAGKAARTAITSFPTQPIVTGSYSVSGGAVTQFNNGNTCLEADKSYAQFNVEQNLYGLLSSGNPVPIEAYITFDYRNDLAAMQDQFPANPDPYNPDVGTKLYVKSSVKSVQGSGTNDAYSVTKENGLISDNDLAFSTLYYSMHDTTNYYSKEETKKASLVYHTKDSELNGDLGNLGINPLDMTDISGQRIETVGILNYGDYESLAASCGSVRVKLTLEQKVDDNYASVSAISDFMDHVYINGVEQNISGFEIDIHIARTSRNSPEEVYINLDVKNADDLNTALRYTNYKVTLYMELEEEENGDYISVVPAEKEDYIVYTNARILPDFINLH